MMKQQTNSAAEVFCFAKNRLFTHNVTGNREICFPMQFFGKYAALDLLCEGNIFPQTSLRTYVFSKLNKTHFLNAVFCQIGYLPFFRVHHHQHIAAFPLSSRQIKAPATCHLLASVCSSVSFSLFTSLSSVLHSLSDRLCSPGSRLLDTARHSHKTQGRRRESE